MKSLLFSFIMALFFIGCGTSSNTASPESTKEKSKQELAELSVKLYLTKVLENPASYEAGEFGALQTKNSDSAKAYIRDFEQQINQMKANKHADQMQNVIKGIQETIDELYFEVRNKVSFIAHKYKFKNKAGAVQFNKRLFTLDSALVVIR